LIGTNDTELPTTPLQSTKEDRELARLYKLSADQGHALGQSYLGFFYEDGRGGLSKATMWRAIS
jgi:TPR repeat protein